MANEKISEYTDTAVAIADTDLFDISVDQGAGVFQTEKITGLSLKTALSSNTIYTGNDSLTGNRQVDLGGFNLSFTGTTSFIGIGIIAASPFRLHIASLVNEDPLRVDTNSSNNALTIIDDGVDSLVGIGTGAASEHLQNVGNTRLDGKITRNVSSTSALSSVHFASDSTDGLKYQVSAAGNFSAPSIDLFRTRGTIAAPTVVLRDDILGEFSVSPYNGTAPYKSASMRMIATEFHSGILGGTAIHWTTTANLGIINTVKMALDHDGNLGINTTAPTEKFMVVGNARINGNFGINTAPGVTGFLFKSAVDDAANVVFKRANNADAFRFFFGDINIYGNQFTIRNKAGSNAINLASDGRSFISGDLAVGKNNSGGVRFRSTAIGNTINDIPILIENLAGNHLMRLSGEGTSLWGNSTGNTAMGIRGTGGAQHVGRPSATLEIRGDESGTALLVTDGITVDKSVVSGDTRFLIYDVDNATVERVTVGAADSGGTNFKLLRIPN